MKKVFILGVLALTVLLAAACSSSGGGSDVPEECPDGQVLGSDGKCHDIPITDGDEEQADGDSDTPVDGDVESPVDGDTDKPVDGDDDPDVTDGDTDPPVDGDRDPDAVDGDVDPDRVDKDSDPEPVDGDTDPVDDDTDPDPVDADADPDPVDNDQSSTCVPGTTCDINDDCGYGCWCHLSECRRDCQVGTEFLCEPNCCNYALGKCEECPDGDVDDDPDGPISCTTDENCPQYWLCSVFNFCEKGECDDQIACEEGFYCDDHGRCRRIPEDDSRVDQLDTRARTKCQSDTDCPLAQICDWNEEICVPGCRNNGDCLPEAPNCIKGICY